MSPLVSKKLGLPPYPPWEQRSHVEQNLELPLKYLLQVLQVEICWNSYYFGIQTVKSPVDFWIYQEIIYEVKPDVIIEVGNFFGGSTLALAHILANIGEGRVIGLDIDHSKISFSHPRITFITGNACEQIKKVKELIAGGDKVLVIEDSSHEYQNTLDVMRTFGPLVTPGSYMIVEDSLFYHGIDIGPNPGPYEAIEQFMVGNMDFIIDRSRERFIITTNPKGYLKRI